MLWVTIFVFVGLLLLLVLVHELGHFLVARAAGCRVDEFAFGFPPRLWSVKRGDTTYAFNLLPLGGYVKIRGEDMEEAEPGPDSFAAKSAGWRVLILSAGVLMNLVLAVVLLSVQAGIGVPTLVTDENRALVRDLQTFIVEVDPDSPAADAGLQALDRVVAIDAITQPTIDQVQDVVAARLGESVVLEVERMGLREELTVVPRIDPPVGEGAMGVALQSTGLEKVAWWKAPWAGLTRTKDMLVAIVSQFGVLLQRLFTEGNVGESLTGPVGIAVYTNEVTQLGWSYVLEFGALISINLAIINILPFPALDGGRILFIGIEAVLRRRMPVKVEQYAHLTGFTLLILLMLFITFKDVGRYI